MNLKDLGSVGIVLIPIVFLLFFLPVQFGGNTYFLATLSGSMEPEFPVGSVIVAKEADISTLEVGDVIAFKPSIDDESRTLVTHRIAEITDEGFKTKGDANSDIDSGIVIGEQVVAKAEFVVPYLGYGLMELSKLLRSALGLLLLLLIPASILLIGELRRIVLAVEVDRVMKGLRRFEE